MSSSSRDEEHEDDHLRRAQPRARRASRPARTRSLRASSVATRLSSAARRTFVARTSSSNAVATSTPNAGSSTAPRRVNPAARLRRAGGARRARACPRSTLRRDRLADRRSTREGKQRISTGYQPRSVEAADGCEPALRISRGRLPAGNAVSTAGAPGASRLVARSRSGTSPFGEGAKRRSMPWIASTSGGSRRTRSASEPPLGHQNRRPRPRRSTRRRARPRPRPSPSRRPARRGRRRSRGRGGRCQGRPARGRCRPPPRDGRRAAPRRSRVTRAR